MIIAIIGFSSLAEGVEMSNMADNPLRGDVIMVDDPEAFVETVNLKKNEIRKALGLKIGKQVRIVPEIAFVLDTTQESAQSIENILSKLDIPKAPEEDEDEG